MRVAWVALLGLGWASLAGAGALLWLEESGRLNHWIERQLAARLGPAAGQLTIERTDLTWMARRVTFSGLSFGRQGEGLTLDAVEVRLGWTPRRGVHLQSLVASGGRLRVTDSLVEALEELVSTDEEEAARELESDLPVLVVRDLDVSVETPEWGDIAVGVVDACLQPDVDGRPTLTGRLVNGTASEDGTGTVYLSGRLDDQGVLSVRGAARDLALSAELLPLGAPADFAAVDPRARFDLEVLGSYAIGRDVLPRFDVAVALRDGRAQLPWIESPERRAVDRVDLALEASFVPGEPPSFWERSAWSATASARARWAERTGTVGVLLGRAAQEGASAEAWVHFPKLPVDGRLLELADHPRWMVGVAELIRPGGEGELLLGMRVPDTWRPTQDLLGASEQALALIPGEGAEVAYVGQVNPESGLRDQGFPLPLEGVQGLVTYVQQPRSRYPAQLALHDLTAHHGGGLARAGGASFWLAESERGQGIGEPFTLVVETAGLPVDETLREAFAGLVGVKGCESIWTDYAPSGGSLGFRLEFWMGPDLAGLATDLTIDFDGVGFRWTDWPFPVEDVRGRFSFIGEDAGEDASLALLALEGRGTSSSARGPLRMAGRMELGPGDEERQRWEVVVPSVNLRSARLHEVLDLRNPETREALEEVGAAGWVDVALTVSQRSVALPTITWVEGHAAEAGLRLHPLAFPMETRDVVGRLVSRTETPPGPEDEVESLTEVRGGASASWSAADGGVPIWTDAFFPMVGPGRVRAVGAGLEIDNPAVLGALETALSRDEEVSVEFDLTELDVAGQLDFEVRFTLPEVDGGDLTDSEVSLQVRLDRLGVGGVNLLKDLEGRLVYLQADELWVGDSLTGLLGSTPVALRDLRVRRDDSGLVELETRLSAEGLPIDREHLQYFLDERTLRTLLEELECRGRFDVQDGALSLISTPAEETALRFRGGIAFKDMYVVLGLPVSVASTQKVDLDLFYEGNRVRARAGIEGLYGQVAGRRLDDASMQVTYIEPRLTIEEFDGKFEGGLMRSLGHRSATTAGFFSLDLEQPFPFALAAELDEVDVGQLLRGVFNSDFANEGRLDGTLQLRGDVEHLTEVRGSGEFTLKDSGLWAIPVFQALFSQLGFETTAVFSRMESRWSIDDGVIQMKRMRMKSDLLSLVGEGTVDFDGTLHHDLEVRYSLVDKLGPLTRLLYYIQNSLLRIAIRGDMSRPEVVTKGFLSQFFAPASGQRKLPLPGYGELRPRF